MNDLLNTRHKTVNAETTVAWSYGTMKLYVGWSFIGSFYEIQNSACLMTI